MSLPNDLVDYILSFLQTDLVTLQNCVQSHPTLARLCEPHIYADITLCDDDLQATEYLVTSAFVEILNKRPDIAKYVRSLTVLVSTPDRHLYLVASLLPMFTGLTKLKIENESVDGMFLWSEIPEIFHQAIVDFLLRCGKKEVLVRYAMYFPLSLLNICKDVRVTLDVCLDTLSTKDVLPTSLEPFEHLSVLLCSETCLESIISWLRLRRLRSLEYKPWWLWGGVEEARKFARILVACSNSLTNLCLDIDTHFQTSYEISNGSALYKQDIARIPFSLADLCHLERLTIRADIGLKVPKSPIPAIMEFILTTSSPTFKQVFLEFSFWNLSLVLPDPEGIWLPFVPLAASCSSRSVTVHFSEVFSSTLSSVAVCGGLIPYVEKGVLVVV